MAMYKKIKILLLSLCVALASSMILSSGVVAAQTGNVLKKDSVNIVIDGVQQNYPQPAVAVNGRTLVPLRGIFEALGAKVEWDNATRTATGTKDGIEVVVQIDNKTAYVNGKAVELDVPAQIIGGSTMVPLRFISESLGARVEWDNATRTAIITSQVDGGTIAPTQPAEETKQEVVDEQGTTIRQGIKVEYGNHHYGSKTQQEFDKVMSTVREKLRDLDNYRFGGERNEVYFYEFLNGKRWDGDRSNRTEENRGLFQAEDQIGVLVSDGLSNDTVVEMYKAASLARDLLSGSKDPLDGTPRSAYDVLFNKVQDCDAIAQVYSVVFDLLGYNTAIYGVPGHAQIMVEVDGNWYTIVGTSFSKIDELPTSSRQTAQYYWFEVPTYGKVDARGTYTR